MKTIILAGGLGTRLSEETVVRPKPMVEIGGRPLLWHIMNIYGAHGHNDFIIAGGYKAEMIKSYFYTYRQFEGDLVIDMKTGRVDVHGSKAPDWRVTVLDTGMQTQTGGRVKRASAHCANETFMMTYGDGVGNIDIGRLVQFHKSHGKLVTITAVRPPARFGGIQFDGDKVVRFFEKPQIGEGWINGGYMVVEPRFMEYIEGDSTFLEREPLERAARDGQLMAYRHEGYWQPMDTLREKHILESLWEEGKAPWKIW